MHKKYPHALPGQRLTSSQTKLWAGQILMPENPLYNMAIACHINGQLNHDKFIESWKEVEALNPVFRTRFNTASDEPTQYIDSAPIEMELLNFSTLSNEKKAGEYQGIKQWLIQRTSEPMHLSKRLTETCLIKLDKDHWVWFCKQHHLITDALSFQIIWKELMQAYITSRENETPTVAHKDPYSSYVQFEHAWRTEAKAPEKSLAHWTQRNKHSLLNLYASPVGASTTRSTRVRVKINQERLASLENLSTSPYARSFGHHMSRHNVIAMTLYALLYRLSGENNLSIGSPALNRSNHAFQDATGLFIEILPLAINLEKDETFASLLSKVRTESTLHMKHAYPGACANTLSEDLTVILNYITATLGKFGELSTEPEWIHPGHIDRNHAIRVQVTDWSNNGEIALDFDFNDGHFDSQRRESLIKQWWMLFDAMANNAQQIIGRVDLVGIIEKQPQTECTFKHTPAGSTSVLQQIDNYAEKFPDAIAVRTDDETLSYQMIQQQADVIASHLIRLKLGRGDRVGIYLKRGIQLPAVVLGILRAGAAYVPIESSHPRERVHYLINDSDVSLVITDKYLLQNIDSSVSTGLIEDLFTNSASAKDTVLRNSPEPTDPAYILYTSGSTGQPKGVVVTHSALLNYCQWATNFYAAGNRLTFALHTPLSFDLTVTSLFVPLMSGGSIVVYPEAEGSTNSVILNVIADNCVDIIKLTPAHLAMIQSEDLSRSRIKQLIVGGENLNRELANKITDAFGGDITIHNEYGPTEATVGCIVHTYNPSADTAPSVPIGKVVAGMSALILNEHRSPQPDGVAGELYVGGASLAAGYWGNPELTNARFINEPSLSNDTLYRTGDLAIADSTGVMTYLGRTDAQIKIRGARIEPAEIESTMLSHPNVTSCTITAGENIGKKPTLREQYCTQCGLSSITPNANFDEHGVCQTCVKFRQYQAQADSYFEPLDKLASTLLQPNKNAQSKYHCMMLLSGGKDSTFALAKLVDMGISVLAYTLDNGFISEDAIDNINRVCRDLGVDHHFGSTPAMNEIFVDSLKRHSNVCNGCFKTIYTLSMKKALDLNIPYIVTGLSRGQFFETRLTEDLFTNPDIDTKNIDSIVLSARKAYHHAEDAIATLLDVSHLQDDQIFEQVRFLDFYRYCSVSLDDMYHYLHTRLPWARPADTGRSTNCLINDVGIYVHKKERGFHNYAIPYSWDVRLGHKKRDQALKELNDSINEEHVKGILTEIGYPQDEPILSAETSLTLYYTSSGVLTEESAREWLSEKLPRLLIPSHFIHIDKLPLNDNGKVDKARLIDTQKVRSNARIEYVAPTTKLEQKLATLWSELLNVNPVGITDNFFDLGGDSLLAIRIVAQLNRQGYTLKASQLFETQTIVDLAAHCIQNEGLATTDVTAKRTPFASLASSQKTRLKKLLQKQQVAKDK